MKLILFVTAVIAFADALTQEQRQKLSLHHSECEAQIGVDKAILARARNGQYTEDAKLMEYLYCVSKKAGFQDDSGHIKRDVLKTKLTAAINDEAKAQTLSDKCALEKDSPQRTAYDAAKCFSEVAHINLA